MASLEMSAADMALAASRSETRRYRLYSLAIVVVLLIAWEAAPRLGLVSPIILPAFSKVMAALVSLAIPRAGDSVRVAARPAIRREPALAER